MKIRFVTPWYGVFAGGAEFAVRRLAENLQVRGLDVGILTTCCRSPFDDWWTDFYAPGEYDVNGVPVTRFPVNKEGADLYHRANHKIIHQQEVLRDDELNFMRGCINSHALICYVRKNRQYAYVFSPYLYGPAVWGILAAPERSVLLPALHDESAAHWQIVRKMFLNARKVVFLSEPERALAERLYGSVMSSMPLPGMGVDVTITFDPARFRKKYGINDPFLIYVGRKVNGKGVSDLVAYFKRYTEKYDRNIRMVFIGEGDSSIVPNGDKSFIDLGCVPEQDKHDAMAASVALCNLSAYESFSFVIMESWLTGRPVIVSAQCDVTTAHCVKSRGGFSISNADEFCLHVHQLSQMHDMADRMGENGKRYVLEHFPWDRVAPKYIRILEEVR